MSITNRPNVIEPEIFGIEHLLIHQAELHRYGKQKNPAGGWTQSWAKVRDVKCRFTVYAPKDQVKIAEQQETFPTMYKVFTLGGEDIVETDRFKFQNKVYEVKNVVDPSFVGHHLEIEVKVVPKDVA